MPRAARPVQVRLDDSLNTTLSRANRSEGDFGVGAPHVSSGSIMVAVAGTDSRGGIKSVREFETEYERTKKNARQKAD